MISAEPAQRVRWLAETAQPHAELVAALCAGSRGDIHRAAERVPLFEAQYREYLEKSGDRCLEEWKLESATLDDDPLTLLRAVGQLARRLDQGGGPAAEAEAKRRQ